MKICTWNLMRPTNRTVLRNNIFHNTIKTANPDILILTETNSNINPGVNYFSSSTTELPADFENLAYEDGENRVTIYSKFPFGRHFKTCDEYTSVCSEVLSLNGSLIIYATIIGVTGGKDKRFVKEFINQKEDISKLSLENDICVAGDFNISFSGFPYPSHSVIKEAEDFFENVGLKILTANNLNSPDHIAISKSFIKDSSLESSELPFERKITDHSFITTTLLF